MVGIGLIGAGRIGKLHASTIRRAQNCRLVAVYDEQRASAETLTSIVGGTVCDHVDALIDNPAVDAVFVCSPTDTHVDMVTLSARAGKAVFCEKPIDLDIARVLHCVSVLEQHPVPFAMGFHRRFDPHHREMYDEIRRGRIGQIEQIHFVSRDPAPPPLAYIQRSGGIFRDMMIHDLDQCRFILGEELDSLFATGSVLVDPQIGTSGDFDTVTATLWTSTGVSCTIQNSRRCSYGFDQRIEVFGSKGSIALGNVPLTQTCAFGDTGLVKPTLPRHFPQRYHDAYDRQLAAFVDTVTKGTVLCATALDGLWALVLADAAERSVRTGQLVRIADRTSPYDRSDARRK